MSHRHALITRQCRTVCQVQAEIISDDIILGTPRRRHRMSAKHKLNSAHFMGSLLLAGLLGWVTGSPTVFLIALVVSLIAGYYAGDIRR
jgi:hypothetical protein